MPSLQVARVWEGNNSVALYIGLFNFWRSYRVRSFMNWEFCVSLFKYTVCPNHRTFSVERMPWLYYQWWPDGRPLPYHLAWWSLPGFRQWPITGLTMVKSLPKTLWNFEVLHLKGHQGDICPCYRGQPAALSQAASSSRQVKGWRSGVSLQPIITPLPGDEYENVQYVWGCIHAPPCSPFWT